MKYYTILLFTILISSQLFSQDKIPNEFAERKKEIQPYFDKIPQKDYAQLVPFYQDGLWGYLNAKTLKVAVPPFANLLNFYGEIPEFMGNSFLNGSQKGFLLNIENGKIQMNYTDLEKAMPPPMMNFSEDRPQSTIRRSFFGAKVKSSTEGFQGFEYQVRDGQYHLTAYSDLYNPNKQSSPDIVDLVMDKQMYLIVKKDFLYGLIDSSGTPLKGFDFKFKKILPVQLPGNQTEHWFLVAEEMEGKEVYSFINNQGQYKLKHELNGDFAQLWNTNSQDYPYYKIKYHQWGYVISNGILYDLLKLEQPVKPAYNSSISSLKIVSEDEEKPNQTLEDLRKNAKLFLLIEEEGKMYYMDFNGKKYLPK